MKNHILLKLNKKNQKGAALITALFLLVILTMLALSSMGTNIMGERMASNSQEKSRALRAAEIGVEKAFNDVRAYQTSNTKANANRYKEKFDNIGDYGADVEVEAIFINSLSSQRSKDGDAETIWDKDTKIFFYEMSAKASTKSGASSNVSIGVYSQQTEPN